MRPPPAPLLLALATLVATPAHAALDLVSQDRSVSMEVVHGESYFASCIPLLTPGCQPDSTTSETFDDEETAPDADPWSATAALPAFPSTFASQDSEIGAALVEASGSHAGVSSYSNTGGFPITFISEPHASDSAFEVVFELEETHGFTLTGSVTTGGWIFSSSNAFVRLEGPGAVLVAEEVVDSDPNCTDPSCFTVGPEAIDTSGMLPPGVYTLSAGASGIAQGVHSTSGSYGSGYDGAWDLTLELTGPPAVPVLPPGAAAMLAAALVLATRPAWRLRSARGSAALQVNVPAGSADAR